MTAKKVLISGLVQGVYFRASAKDKALELGLNGWVRNAEDSCVEVYIEGKDPAINSFIAWCYQGSPAAEVSDVKIEDCEEEGCKGFEILH